MRESRKRLVTRVLARISKDLFPHKVIGHILSRREFGADVREIAAALARVELDQRRVWSRIAEYTYVLFRLPGYSRVTLGPSQLSLARLRRPVAHCSCELLGTRNPMMNHCFGTRHHVSVLLMETSAAALRLNHPREVANAHNKGDAARDLSTPTVYSEIVLGLGPLYSENLGTS